MVADLTAGVYRVGSLWYMDRMLHSEWISQVWLDSKIYDTPIPVSKDDVM
jgi:hypothetical protein